MSGHSKWAKIKHQKGVNDAKRGMIFTKLAKNITLAAKEGGGDTDMNFTLRLAVSKAKAVNMPADNIERAIKKGTGGDSKLVFQRVSYEARVGSVSIIVDCQTDNVNRTVSEVKRILEAYGGKMVAPGGVSWNFEERGLVNVICQKVVKANKFGANDSYQAVNPEDLELILMEVAGVEDIKGSFMENEDGRIYVLEVYVSKNNLKNVSLEIEKMGYKVESFELVKIAKEKVKVNEDEKNKIEKLIETLEENDDVNETWINME